MLPFPVFEILYQFPDMPYCFGRQGGVDRQGQHLIGKTFGQRQQDTCVRFREGRLPMAGNGIENGG